MRITIRIKHHKKSKLKHISPAIWFFTKDCSTGPIIKRGESWSKYYDLEIGDTVEFSTTKFDDEFDVRVIREGEAVNASH